MAIKITSKPSLSQKEGSTPQSAVFNTPDLTSLVREFLPSFKDLTNFTFVNKTTAQDKLPQVKLNQQEKSSLWQSNIAQTHQNLIEQKIKEELAPDEWDALCHFIIPILATQKITPWKGYHILKKYIGHAPRIAGAIEDYLNKSAKELLTLVEMTNLNHRHYQITIYPQTWFGESKPSQHLSMLFPRMTHDLLSLWLTDSQLQPPFVQALLKRIKTLVNNRLHKEIPVVVHVAPTKQCSFPPNFILPLAIALIKEGIHVEHERSIDSSLLKVLEK